MLAQLLDAQPQQSRSTTRRQVEDGARLLVVFSNFLGEVRVWERCSTLSGPDQTVVNPDGDVVAVKALGYRNVMQIVVNGRSLLLDKGAARRHALCPPLEVLSPFRFFNVV